MTEAVPLAPNVIYIDDDADLLAAQTQALQLAMEGLHQRWS